MKYKHYHEIDAPMEMLIELTQKREERDVRVYPNITSVKVLKRKKKGKKQYTKIETCANGDIPPRIRKIITPKMLTWVEEGEFDYSTNTYTFKVTPFYMANVFKMSGTAKWKKLENGKTARELRGEIKVKIPVLGRLIEKKIIETQRENLDLDVKSMVEEVKEILAKKK